jgi:SAM-dependent methyltransferase
MSETDWEARYVSKDMPWEKGEPSPGLVDFLGTHPGLDRGSVAIPGCGTGHDARAWANAGFKAHGFDIATTALQLAREKTESAGLVATFEQRNFLQDDPAQPFDWLFEHTLFCAIDPARRDEYARAVVRWLKPGGQFLAVFYIITDTDGPPFGTNRAEIISRFSPFFNLLEEWMPRSYPNRTGLELMMWWQRK